MSNVLKTILSYAVAVACGVALGFVLACAIGSADAAGASGIAVGGFAGFLLRAFVPKQGAVGGAAGVVSHDVSSALAAASTGRREAEQRCEELTRLNAGLQQQLNGLREQIGQLQSDAKASTESGQQLDNLITGGAANGTNK